MTKVNVTLLHSSGAVSGYKPGDLNPGGIKEAILVSMDRAKAVQFPLGVVRADLDGATWKACEAAGAVPEILSRMQAATQSVLDGLIPRIFFDVNGGEMTNARLVFSQAEVDFEGSLPNARSVPVPTVLPYQLGGGQEGAHILLYRSEAERSIAVHSIHPNQAEARLAEQHLHSQLDVQSAIMVARTPVTQVVASVMTGARFERAAQSEAAQASGGLGASALSSRQTASQVRSMLGKPSPYAGA